MSEELISIDKMEELMNAIQNAYDLMNDMMNELQECGDIESFVMDDDVITNTESTTEHIDITYVINRPIEKFDTTITVKKELKEIVMATVNGVPSSVVYV